MNGTCRYQVICGLVAHGHMVDRFCYAHAVRGFVHVFYFVRKKTNVCLCLVAKRCLRLRAFDPAVCVIVCVVLFFVLLVVVVVVIRGWGRFMCYNGVCGQFILFCI